MQTVIWCVSLVGSDGMNELPGSALVCADIKQHGQLGLCVHMSPSAAVCCRCYKPVVQTAPATLQDVSLPRGCTSAGQLPAQVLDFWVVSETNSTLPDSCRLHDWQRWSNVTKAAYC